MLSGGCHELKGLRGLGQNFCHRTLKNLSQFGFPVFWDQYFKHTYKIKTVAMMYTCTSLEIMSCSLSSNV